MEINWTTILTALIAVLGTALPGLWALRHQRRKDRVEADRIRSETADKIVETSQQQVSISLSLIEPLKKKTSDLEVQMVKLRAEFEARIAKLGAEAKALEYEIVAQRKSNGELENVCTQLLDGCTRLVHQVRSLDSSPVFIPSRDIGPQPSKEPKP